MRTLDDHGHRYGADLLDLADDGQAASHDQGKGAQPR